MSEQSWAARVAKAIHTLSTALDKRREMAADICYWLMTKKHLEDVVISDLIQYAINEAVTQGWAIRNDDGTITFTGAWRQHVKAREPA